MDTLNKRFTKLKARLTDEKFLHNRGLSNELGYYIFPYDAKKEELKIREYIKELVNKYTVVQDGFKVREFNLYNIVMDIVAEEGFQDGLEEIEEEYGIGGVISQVAESLGLDEDDNEIVNYIDDNTTKNNEVVFLTGVGQIFPLLRSHKILNILQQKLDKVPLIMFFPGSYSGRSLDIFNVVHDDNYYRAFKLD
ncbi:DUF1788 domain-containing protein [Leuconostoc gasicomitatum]|uniref:DUF1788 domain-containing protein n=1 Tax=Leuconostoc gasicomitatum TaxID=115778 RepID=UPI000744AC2A|nr:DUF1788 domain-containing protein [Leuconostoc gasicomitatum]MBR2276604.1 DUF1788 domain-containing protein [Leuconostoc sp.]MBZ5953929.1 DUF1788 domain-containing protein [Leuconostoc gasicomitatum]MBZ5955400.1 DUF1788 domain-containing protein [Leuconostoc gasicomitatum]MBZ5987388.1 DUF1788 domain-containing protein [Leuconostoc gasicomitatum]MBZ5990938.1 DUF1788 domain-containing protein [Leuconostoc gasicomitatum]